LNARVAGPETNFRMRPTRHCQTKGLVTDRIHLRDCAPVLDPKPTSPIGYSIDGFDLGHTL
jgi:hypothetical protein